MASLHSSTSQRRPGGKDEPEDLRQLRQEHGGSLATLKELFADWTEEDLLYAIQDAGGDVELAILRISEGHVTQWGEVKGKKKTPKPKTASEKQEFRTSNSQRGGFAGRGRGDALRGGRGGATRGAPRALNGGDRNGRPTKSETATTSEQILTDSVDSKTDSNDVAAAADSTAETAPAWGTTPSTTNDSSNTTDAWSTPATTAATTSSNESWGAASAATNASTDAWGAAPATTTSTETAESWVSTPAAATAASAPVRKLNIATIPAGSKMSWAKIVKPEPAPAPKPVAAPAPKETPAPAPAPAPVAAPVAEPEVAKVEEPIVEEKPEALAVTEEEAPEETTPEVVEPVVEEKVEEPVVAAEPANVAEPTETASTDAKTATPVGPPGLKAKAASQPRRLNQDAPVVMPSGSSALQSVGVKFGSFSLNDDSEAIEPEVQPEQPAQVAQPEQPAQQATPAPAQSTAQTQQTQQPATYARQPSASGASGYQGTSPAAPSGLSPAATNASYLKQDPAANYLGQHHHHPGMGHDAMGSPYGSYMPNPANQLGSFGMGPMASLPNDYAALYGNDLQRAMYYDPASYGQVPVTAANNYQSRDSKYNQDAASTVSTSGASTTSTTQAQQTLQQQQQQQQQAYPNMAGGMPYYPYYYMAPNQFPNAYQQSGYGQPFVNKNMYPMYQHQQQQQHSNKPGAASSSPYGNYSSTAGQGHHQYSQAGYEDMSGAGIHGMGGLNNDPYAKYGNPGMQNFLGNQQQPATPTSNASGTKGNTGSNNYSAADKSNAAAGSQSSSASQMAGGASLQGQQPGANNVNQGQQGYYQQQMFSNYQYPSHHQGYHPNQHQGQHQGSGRNQQQQFWGSQN